MKKEILTYEENKEILTQKSTIVEEITEEIKELVNNLIDTLKETSGVGISAIQIGIPKQVCIIKNNGEYIPMINPEIFRMRGETTFNEGCLSAPGQYKDVERAEKVWCRYLDLNGKEKEISQGGLCSIIIQHELDHFEGWCEVFDNYKGEEEC